MDLQLQVGTLERRNQELEAGLAEVSARPDSLPEEIVANTPHVARIHISRLSHVRDDDGDGKTDTLIVYVRPVDGLGRFVQIVGSLAIHAGVLPVGEDAVTIGRIELSPGEVRAAYRSGATGTHYTIQMPFESPFDASECDVRVTYTDGRSGRAYNAHESIALQ